MLVIRNLAKDRDRAALLFDPLRLDEHLSGHRSGSVNVSLGVLDRSGRIVAHTDRSSSSRTGHGGRRGRFRLRKALIRQADVREIRCRDGRTYRSA
jgi:hypothetical protein